MLLEELDLTDCKNLTHMGLNTFLSKTGGNLRQLVLNNTNVSCSGIISATTRFLQMEELYLNYCRNMTDTGLNAILSKIGPNLRKLVLSNTSVSLTGIEFLTTSFLQMEALYLSHY